MAEFNNQAGEDEIRGIKAEFPQLQDAIQKMSNSNSERWDQTKGKAHR